MFYSPDVVEQESTATQEVAREVVDAVRALEIAGRVAPETVVDAARDPGSPLHAFFDWDDTEAASKWRVEQARKLLRSIRVEVRVEDAGYIVPMYTRDPKAEGPGYISSEQIRKEPESVDALLSYEFSRAAAHLSRAKLLAKAYSGLAKQIDKLSNGIEKMRRKVARKS